MGRVVQESLSVLMAYTFSGPRRVSAGSGYSGWSAEETWRPGWKGQTFEEAIEHGPKDVRSSGEGDTSGRNVNAKLMDNRPLAIPG